MSLIRTPSRWLVDITGHFPTAVQPGLFGAIVLLIGWLLLRRRRPVWNGSIRLASAVADFTVGLMLLPEYAWTSARRAKGQTPSALALVGSQLAERVLDRAAVAYERHSHVRVTGRPPLVWAILFCVTSLVAHWLMLRTTPSGITLFAAKIWGYWSSFDDWARQV
jgi:hypothetical protein